MRIDCRLLLLARSAGFTLAAAVALGFAAGVLVVIQARELSQVIAAVYLEGASLGEVKGGLILLSGVILLRAGLAWGAETNAGLAAVRIKTSVRRQIFEHVINLGPAFGREQNSGELVNTCTEGVEALDAYFSQYLPQIALAALVPVAFLVIIFPVDPLSAAILLVTAPLIPIFMVLIGSRAEELTKRQ